MIFYSNTPDLVINSKKTNKIICRFKDGKFETKDPILITKLKPYFRNDGIDHKSLDYWGLKKEAEKKGIETHKIKKADLIKALEECER